MSQGRRKTRAFKDRQCRYCARADKSAFRKGWPCCPLEHPHIENGHCRDREPTENPIVGRGKAGSVK